MQWSMVIVMVVAEQKIVVANGRHRAASAGTVADVVDEHGGYGARSGKARCPGGSLRRGGREGREEGARRGQLRRGAVASARARRHVRARHGVHERRGRGRVWGVCCVSLSGACTSVIRGLRGSKGTWLARLEGRGTKESWWSGNRGVA